MAETGTDLVQRTPAQMLVARVRSPEFASQAALVLPETVSAKRFVRATVTALLQNPDIAKAEPDSILQAVLRAAQDGLLPDGREAALVLYGQKAQYLPMVAGFRKIAAEHGWELRAEVVYANDKFEHALGLEGTLKHTPVRPGAARGELIAAYAVGKHRDGRKLFTVMYAEDIEKVRKSSRAGGKGPWVDWTDRMWAKTVARRLFKELPLDPNDVRIARVLADDRDAAEQLYGPETITEHVNLETGEIIPAAALPTDTNANGAAATDAPQQAAVAVAPVAAVPGDPDEDDEPEPGPRQPDADAVEQAGMTIVPNGAWKGMTLAQVQAAGEDGASWFDYVLKRPHKYEPGFYAAVVTFVGARVAA